MVRDQQPQVIGASSVGAGTVLAPDVVIGHPGKATFLQTRELTEGAGAQVGKDCFLRSGTVVYEVVGGKDEDDAEAFRALGVPASRIRVLGDLRLDPAFQRVPDDARAACAGARAWRLTSAFSWREAFTGSRYRWSSTRSPRSAV